jgi:glycosyltransferase involved in cell wall biosynthesis
MSANKKRILHIIPSIDMNYGGPAFALSNLTKMDKSLGYDTNVLSIKGVNHSIYEEYVHMHLTKPNFPKRYYRSKEALNWLRKNIENYDLFVIHGIWSFLTYESALLLSKFGKRYILRPHGSLDPFDLKKKLIVKRFLGPSVIRHIIYNSKGLFCTSQKEATRLVNYGAKANCFVIPLPLEQDKCRPLHLTNLFRKKYNIREDKYVLLFLSRIDYKKGFDILIPALREVCMKHQNVTLVIAGSNFRGYKREVDRLIKKHKVSDHIVYTGLLSGLDKTQSFLESNCFILPSMNENFGNAVVESLSFGLPVIISNNVYISDFIQSNGGGWVCNYSIESLVEAINSSIEDKMEYEENRIRAKNTAAAFSFDNLRPLYRDMYRNVFCS